MKQYDSYKDSRVQWIGEIPSHWTSIPIKYSVRSPHNCFIDGDWIESNVIVTDGIRYLTTGNVGALKYKEQGNGFISEATFRDLQCSEVFPGDLLISRLNEPIGRTCIVPNLGYRIVVAVDNVIYRPDENKFDKQFLVYQMNCKPYADNANFVARGSTMTRVSRTTLGQFKIIVPPLAEQQAIATYLDKKCAEIDKAIATQQKRIELLQELRQNIITQAVTRGINPDAPLKDSGVEWIGMVPEHWEVCKTLYVLSMPITDGPHKTPTLYDSGIPFISAEAISCGEINFDLMRGFISENYYKECCKKYVPKMNDIYMIKSGATTGRIAMVKSNRIFTIWSPLAVFRANNNIISHQYLYYTLKSDYFQRQVELNWSFGTQQNIGMRTLEKIKITFPNLKEQQVIITHLDKKCGDIDNLIAKANRQISLLQELKQSIITEVVTGKRKVC